MNLTASINRQRPTEHLLLLKWLLMMAVAASGFAAAWYFGLLQNVWSKDPTGLTVVITLVFAGAIIQGGVQVLHLSRALTHAGVVHRIVEHQPTAIPGHSNVLPLDKRGTLHLPDGCVSEHIERLIRKAEHASGRLPLDQRPLLEAFEARVARGGEVGWFIADMLMTLGLLGTVIGFILMLAPLGGLQSANTDAMTIALSAMSTGMAVALYTTLTGLAGSALLKVQGFLLDDAVADLVRRTAELTEMYVLPEIERRHVQALESGHAQAA